MWLLKILLLIFTSASYASQNEQPALYYYGLEESERGLAQCGARQACSVLLPRYWRAAAVVRLCRCPRRARCATDTARTALTVPLNNRAHFKFCQPVTDWRECSPEETSLTISAPYERLDPDELEELHHKNIQLSPPKIHLNCLCREPNYWELKSTSEDKSKQHFKCRLMPNCESGEFCGNVRYDLHSLYQSCLCPINHICVHNGGVTYVNISELLYHGRGRQAYCQRITEDYNYDD